MDKFDRNYLLTIEKQDQSLLYVQRPFTIEFEIFRNSLSSANSANFRIYNLAQNTRSQIRKDQFNYNLQKSIEFKAGYGNNLGLAFKGFVTQARSVREGTDFITTVDCFDGGFAYQNSITNQSFVSGTPQSSIIDSLIEDLDGVDKGAIGNYPGAISRGNSYSGTTTDQLSQITGNGFFIDNNTAHCLSDTEAIAGSIPVINAQSGLIGTPILEQQYINITTLFEPGLKIGQMIDLQALSEIYFNGKHKVLSLRHTGVISDAVCGNALTEIGLLPGIFTQVPTASG